MRSEVRACSHDVQQWLSGSRSDLAAAPRRTLRRSGGGSTKGTTDATFRSPFALDALHLGLCPRSHGDSCGPRWGQRARQHHRQPPEGPPSHGSPTVRAAPPSSSLPRAHDPLTARLSTSQVPTRGRAERRANRSSAFTPPSSSRARRILCSILSRSASSSYAVRRPASAKKDSKPRRTGTTQSRREAAYDSS